MPSIFISYRREDTSGEAGHLAADLVARYGHPSVFMDVDSISPGVNFEEGIRHALDSCQVTFVLIGDRWLTVTLPDGSRRLDDDGDYVRQEIAAALVRDDVGVVPVLVEGAKMPSAKQLPADIASLAKLNAFELSNKRWQYDLGQLAGIAERYEKGWLRFAPRIRRWAIRGGPAVAVAAVVAAVVIIANGGSTGAQKSSGAQKSTAAQTREVLFPATAASTVDECQSQLTFAVDGTAGPLTCPRGQLNKLAWQYYEHFNPVVMTLGPNATEGQVINALCADLHVNKGVTNPIESAAYQLAAAYNGWRFVLPPDPATMKC